MSKQPEYTQRKWLSSFGRRWGRRLPSRKGALVKELLPKVAIGLPDGDAPIDVGGLFTDKRAIHMEIGFGGAEHLLGLAQHYSDIGYIGCEPFMNGVANCLVGMEDHSIDNIRIYHDDARYLLERLPDDCIDRIYILFPDPWKKPRHHKRRLVSVELLDMLARIQPKGAELILATDHRDYSAWMLHALNECGGYEWTAKSCTDWQSAPADWTQTRYQAKTSAEGREPVFLYATRAA
ncbi:MAG: tRNA (guanosine(46)-N7)-methyltransferase TrmB [Rickettsiales bacterium]|nr:tRNA (guanosine(46)-N7)-methyltransferase TrmB [Rickettsiales bacterium]